MSDLTEYFKHISGIDQSPFGVAFHILMLLVASVGSIANFAVLISTLARKDITPHSTIIVSLCFADFCLCLTCLITFALHLGYQSWTIPGISAVTGCLINTFFNSLFLHTSGISFVLLAVERYVVILRGWYQHKNWVFGWITLQVSYSLVISSILVTSDDNVQLSTSVLICEPNFPHRTRLIIALGSIIIISIIVGLSAICLCYYCIYQFYKSRNTKGYTSTKINDAKEKKLMIRLLIISGIYVVLYTPWLSAIIYELCTTEKPPYWLSCLFLFCILFNCAINPVLLYKLDPSIKNQFDHIGDIVSKVMPRSTSRDNNLSNEVVNHPVEDAHTKKLVVNSGLVSTTDRATFKISRP